MASSTLEEYEVFLSFRGEDTRHNFTSHLYASLVQNNIKTFIDNDSLQRGDKISQALKEAIERSKLAIIVFSKDYASSLWCLEELVHILRCRERNHQIVVPVFYHVDPSDVRHQRGSFEAWFAKHEEEFGGQFGKVQVWRDALSEAASFAGWDSQVIRFESELVKKIVEDVTKKLNSTPPNNDFKGFFGIESRSKKIEDLLCITSSQVRRVIGIWGMGGIGKTTLALIVFQRLYTRYEICYFVEDIRVNWRNGRKKYYDSDGTLIDHKCFRNKRVLLVLDNVSNPEQLELLAEDCFGAESRIIITTRDMQVLRGVVDGTYKVVELDFTEAFQLFCSIALRKTNLYNHIGHDLIEKIINYAEGIPLALKILSSFLRGKKIEKWEDELNKFKACPENRIMNILRTSYEGLDEMQKCIFLDVACFFKNSFRDDVERILDACGLHPKIVLDDLIDKALIFVTKDNKLRIHDLIQQMAWSITNSSKMIETRSRLWIPQDACHVLEAKKGTREIEGISLDLSKISKIVFDSTAFQDMDELRLLKIFHSDVRKICNISVNLRNCDIAFLPNSIRYFYWEKFPWKSFPPSFKPQNLVEINMPFSHVEHLWEGTQPLGNLIKIDLSQSKNLIELPDLTHAPKLEHVYLENCTSLLGIPWSIQHVGQLKTLNANGCTSLWQFPKLPKSIVCLGLSETSINCVPASIENLQSLEILNLSGCGNLKSLPNFSRVPSLKAIILPRPRKNWLEQYQAPYFVKARISKRSENGSRLVFPLYLYDFCGQASSVAIVSLSKTVLGKKLGYRLSDQNLLCFNLLEFYGGESNTEKLNQHLSTFLSDYTPEKSSFGAFSHLQAEIGSCYFSHKIPHHVIHRSNSNTVDVSFATKPKTQITGFVLCAIIDFSEYRHNMYEDGYKEMELLCEPYYTSRIIDSPDYNMNYNDLHVKNVENWCNGTRSKDISKASFTFWVSPDEDGSTSSARVIKCGVNVILSEEVDPGCHNNIQSETNNDYPSEIENGFYSDILEGYDSLSEDEEKEWPYYLYARNNSYHDHMKQ